MPLRDDSGFFVGFEASRPAEAYTASLGGLHAALCALADHFTFEFGERAKHLEHEAAGRRVGVDVLGEAFEVRAAIL